ncbi:MAG TPA: amino acid ABC transporter substrate-binding protein [Burkholderiales bacterium]|nr:amino acid ABC transporter substrate-binding protein [Burkholderiales bacterium]
MLTILFRAALVCTLGLALLAVAQESDFATPDRLTGTLKKVRDSGVIRIGHRENSVPFAFLDPKGQPIGYSIDLCNAIVEQVIDELGGRDIRVEYRPVTPENRFALLTSGEIDLECGSTTSNLERQKQAAFSPTIFVTGTKLLVRKDSPIKSLRDLKGKTVVVTEGTTNARVMKALAEKQPLGVNFLTGRDHKQSFEILAAGKADAFANDEVLLYGLVADARASDQFRVVGSFLSYEPYGLMYRKDEPQFAEVVERTFERLAGSRELEWIYNRWFLKRLPSGARLNLPMSPQLTEIFRILGLPVE